MAPRNRNVARALNRLETTWALFLVLRVPLFSAGLLVLGPTLIVDIAPTVLRNLYVVEGPGEWALAYGGALMAALSVAMTGFTGRMHPPEGLLAEPYKPRRLHRALFLGGVPVLLSLPTLWRLAQVAPEVGSAPRTWLWCGLLVSLVWFAGWLLTRKWARVRRRLGEAISRLPSPLPAIYNKEDGLLEAGHLSTLAFLIVVAAVYSAGLLAHPGEPAFNHRVPVLAWLHLAQTMMTLLLGGALHLLDHWRLPSFGALMTLALGAWFLFDLDSSYSLIPGPTLPRTEVLHRELQDAIDRRLDQASHGEGAPGVRTMVVVTAAGGGIVSTAWSVRALLGLEQELGDGFTRSLSLLSGASGGSVATLFYLDAELYGPPDLDPAEVTERASRGSLAALGWAIVYNDFWRVMGVPLPWGHERGRGWALEQTWTRRLHRPGATLSDWRTAVLTGTAPLPVLNASLVETGGALSIAPLPLTDEEGALTDFVRLYPEHDLAAVTAARLSATFPWVTPNARPHPRVEPAYHVADGGYFDNQGVYAALLWLERVLLPTAGDGRPPVERVIWLQLDAFQPVDDAQVPALRALEAGLAGPLLTLANARYSTQVVRNAADIERFATLACLSGVEVERFVLRPLPDEDALSVDRAPLSWALSPEERAAVSSAWERFADSPDMEALVRTWGRTTTRCR